MGEIKQYPEDHFKIELCRFHFDNNNLVNYLEKRATLIRNSND